MLEDQPLNSVDGGSGSWRPLVPTSLFISIVESYGVMTVLVVVVTMFSRPVVRTLNLITVPEDSLSLTHEFQPAIPVTVTSPQPQIVDL